MATAKKTSTPRKPKAAAGPAEGPKAEGVAAANRALAVLGAFESSPDGLTLSAIATATGLYESTILRLLDSLIGAGFVKRLADGRYIVGPRVLPLAEMYKRSFKLSDFVLPRLRQLARDSGECAGLYVREGERRVCLHHIQPQRSVRSHVVEGVAFPLDKGAAGHVISAFDGAAAGARYDRIRRDGYVITERERDPESAAISSPVFGTGARLAGAISLVVPCYRFSDEVAATLVPMVMRTAAALSTDLGGAWPYGGDTAAAPAR